jgi:hypothetical protein
MLIVARIVLIGPDKYLSIVKFWPGKTEIGMLISSFLWDIEMLTE